MNPEEMNQKIESVTEQVEQMNSQLDKRTGREK